MGLTAQKPCTKLDDNTDKCLSCVMDVTLNGTVGATQFFSCPNMPVGLKEATFEGVPFISTGDFPAIVQIRLKEFTGTMSATTEEKNIWLNSHLIDSADSYGDRHLKNDGPGSSLATWQRRQGFVWGYGANWALTIVNCNGGKSNTGGCNTQSDAKVSIHMK